MEAGKPIIAVVHATSKQGTSVVNSLLQTGKFAVKAITRDANSECASCDHAARGLSTCGLPSTGHATRTHADVHRSCVAGRVPIQQQHPPTTGRPRG
jgi:hypothetical protein